MELWTGGLQFRVRVSLRVRLNKYGERTQLRGW